MTPEELENYSKFSVHEWYCFKVDLTASEFKLCGGFLFIVDEDRNKVLNLPKKKEDDLAGYYCVYNTEKRQIGNEVFELREDGDINTVDRKIIEDMIRL